MFYFIFQSCACNKQCISSNRPCSSLLRSTGFQLVPSCRPGNFDSLPGTHAIATCTQPLTTYPAQLYLISCAAEETPFVCFVFFKSAFVVSSSSAGYLYYVNGRNFEDLHIIKPSPFPIIISFVPKYSPH